MISDFMDAAASADLYLLSSFLREEGVSINCTEPNTNMTALHYACISGSDAAVRLLLSYGADVNAVNAALSAPLHLACQTGTRYIVERLIAAGADVFAQDEGGNTPTHVACMHDRQELLEVLVGVGVDPLEGLNKDAMSALDLSLEAPSAGCAIYLMRRAGMSLQQPISGKTLFEHFEWLNEFDRKKVYESINVAIRAERAERAGSSISESFDCALSGRGSIAPRLGGVSL